MYIRTYTIITMWYVSTFIYVQMTEDTMYMYIHTQRCVHTDLHVCVFIDNVMYKEVHVIHVHVRM